MKTEPKKPGRHAKSKAKQASVNVHERPRIDPKDEKADGLAELYRKLTKAQLDFVHNFIQADFKNATQCYCNAYPDASREGAPASASRLLSSVNIRTCIALQLDAMMAEAKIPLEKRIFETWMARAFYDVADIIDGDGRLSHSMPELKKLGLSIVIDGIDIKPDKDGGEHVVYKLADKDRALEMLQKYIQMIKQPDQKIKGTGPDGKPFSYVVSFEDAEE